jgi:hypothetical protein
MQLMESQAMLVDKFLYELILYCDTHAGKTLSFQEYLGMDGVNGIVFEHELFHAFIVANYKQKKMDFNVFNLTVDARHGKYVDLIDGNTEAFMSVGGFMGIWQDEATDRTERNSTNDSVRRTNNTVRIANRIIIIASIASFVVAVGSAGISYMSYQTTKNDTAITRQIRVLQGMQQAIERKDTVFVKDLRPQPPVSTEKLSPPKK